MGDCPCESRLTTDNIFFLDRHQPNTLAKPDRGISALFDGVNCQCISRFVSISNGNFVFSDTAACTRRSNRLHIPCRDRADETRNNIGTFAHSDGTRGFFYVIR